MIKHWVRLWYTVLGKYRPGHELWPEGRKSPHKGYWFELGHSLANIPVEYLRHWRIWDRGGKNDRKT
jgi:hypothetical protein